MGNVCAVRTTLIFDPWDRPYFSKPRPHEVATKTTKDLAGKKVVHEVYKNGSPVCKHCGCLYAEE